MEMSEASKNMVILSYIVITFRRWRIREKVVLYLLCVDNSELSSMLKTCTSFEVK